MVVELGWLPSAILYRDCELDARFVWACVAYPVGPYKDPLSMLLQIRKLPSLLSRRTRESYSMFGDKKEKEYDGGALKESPDYPRDVQQGFVSDNADELQRRLGNRQIQLIAIGGTIGTALFVSIGNGLRNGGPGSLFLAYFIYACMLGLVNNCIAEMTVLMPVSGGFIRLAGAWVDEAWGFMAGWNFFLYEAILIPFEITALNLVLTYWSDRIPTAAVCAACIVLYASVYK